MATARGKIGRAPEKVRNQVNAMIRDNALAEDIITFLESNGVSGVTPQNVSAWKRWGFNVWLKREERLEDLSARREFAKRLVDEAREEGDDGISMASDAASAIALQTITEVLEDFDAQALKDAYTQKPEKVVELLHALQAIRLRDQSAVLLRQKMAAARALAQKAAAEAAKSGNTDLKSLADAMDAALGG